MQEENKGCGNWICCPPPVDFSAGTVYVGAVPPEDYEDFLAARSAGFKGLRKALNKRRKQCITA